MSRPPRNLNEAFAYITDCALATVCGMANLKSRKVGEYRRHIAIAQKACDWMVQFNIDPSGTRASQIIGKMTVAEWAAQYEPEPK